MTSSPALIAIDWGTTSFRAYLLAANAAVIDRVSASRGILQIPRSGFEQELLQQCGPWFTSTPGLPIVMCGMIGSQQGWIETGYLSGSCGIKELAAAMTCIRRENFNLHIISGVRGLDFGGMPDVMRGEETILAGAIAEGVAGDGLVCLPGTHSKWVALRHGRIEAFATYMSGELYALLSQHSVLSALVAAGESLPAEIRKQSFRRGLALASSTPDLTHQLFTIRALVLAGEPDSVHAGEMLSGLLVGTEINSIARRIAGDPRSVVLLATGELGARYQEALQEMHWSVSCPDSEQACIVGLHAIAKAAGVLQQSRDEPSDPLEVSRK